MKFVRIILALLPVVADAQNKPDWVNGRSSAYPKDVYLSGVGQGPNQEKAANKARAELAKQFSLSLEARTSATARETSDGAASSFSQDVSDDVRTSTAKVLEGVEIAEYWQGSESYYALAVLNREHSLKILRDKLEEMDRDFSDLESALANAEGKFSRLRVALRLVRLAKDRRKINGDYRILNPEGKGIPAPTSLASVAAKAHKAVAALTFQVDVTGEKGEQLTSRIIDALNAYGLRAVEKNPGPADVLIEGEAQGKKLTSENLLWYPARGLIEVRMSYGSTGELFTRFEESGKDTASDPESSVEVTLLGLSDKAAAHIFKVVMSAELADD